MDKESFYLANVLSDLFIHSMYTKSGINVKKIVKKGYFQSLHTPKTHINQTEEYPIDVVVTWVDGKDPKWISDKNKYISISSGMNAFSNSIARYRDWGILQYWFRAIEQYAPWVRKIFFITYGHTPSWLNQDNEKLVIVNHQDFIPSVYLPTFSSRPIEMNIWRIKELSEHFIYLNDDVILNAPVKKEDFFCNGYMKYAAVAKPLKANKKVGSHLHARLNNYGLINSTFDVRKVIEEHPEKWFPFFYGRNIRHNIYTYQNNYISGFECCHLCFPFRKSSMEKCAKYYENELIETNKNKFRTNQDNSVFLFLDWEIMHNAFEPVPYNYYGYGTSLSRENIPIIREKLFDESVKTICLNDAEISDEDYNETQQFIITILEDKFPTKSSFER